MGGHVKLTLLGLKSAKLSKIQSEFSFPAELAKGSLPANGSLPKLAKSSSFFFAAGELLGRGGAGRGGGCFFCLGGRFGGVGDLELDFTKGTLPKRSPLLFWKKGIRKLNYTLDSTN